MMGYCYFFLGEYDKAFEELNPIMDDINTDEERAYSIIGIVKQKKELHKEAIIDFKKCLSFNPNNYDSLFGLAECFL